MIVLLGGDFRQVLPVVPRGRREDIVDSCITESYLWKHFNVYKLTENMRLTKFCTSKSDRQVKSEFSQWILNIGDGVGSDLSGESWVEIPHDMLLISNGDDFGTIVDSTYPDLNQRVGDPQYFRERAILAPRNEMVDDINSYVVDLINGEEREYCSVGSICQVNS